MTPIDRSADHIYEVVVVYFEGTTAGPDEPCAGYALGGDSCNWGNCCNCPDTNGGDRMPVCPGPDDGISVVRHGLYRAASAQAARDAAARMAGFGSVAQWYCSLAHASDWPLIVDSVFTPIHHLSEDDLAHLVTVPDDAVNGSRP